MIVEIMQVPSTPNGRLRQTLDLRELFSLEVYDLNKICGTDRSNLGSQGSL